ncbi:hypothetical protein [Caulobacter soli]|uniref:hypothetical protein n=1 Tax=Caulobacter soli TaxID=2708539 RepID=UPI0013ECD553|nr:hypothetical protein [Caulobacter soli]
MSLSLTKHAAILAGVLLAHLFVGFFFCLGAEGLTAALSAVVWAAEAAHQRRTIIESTLIASIAALHILIVLFHRVSPEKLRREEILVILLNTTLIALNLGNVGLSCLGEA